MLGLGGTAHADATLSNGSTIVDDVLYLQGSTTTDVEEYYSLTESAEVTLKAIQGEIAPKITQDQFSISSNNSKLTVTGAVNINAKSTEIANENDQGTYLFYAVNGGTIDLQGDIEITAIHALENQVDSIGNNVFYASGENSKITIGSEDSTTKAWAIANKPDLISAKKGATVEIQSTQNQLVGSMDMVEVPDITGLNLSTTIPNITFDFKKDTITGTFSGADSYWYGDEQSFMNAIPSGSDNLDLVSQVITSGAIDCFDLTFEHGAQWSYFGISEVFSAQVGKYSGSVKFNGKRISSITLRDGGIINLYNENIQQTWDKLGLLDAFPGLDEVNHDYVRIGNLKGTGGIFRLDLNAENKDESDMIFVESSKQDKDGDVVGGNFFIEPYKPELLTSITPENTLRFATVSADSGITFADSQNIYGQTLYDYELVIDHEEYSEDDPDNSTYEEKLGADANDQFLNDFNSKDKVNWFIKRVNVRESAASLAMTSAGYVVYDAVTHLDRYDSRNTEVSRYAGAKEGVWARVKHGNNGAKNQYDGDYTKASVGFDHYLTPSNRIGIGFTYLTGDADFEDVRGSGELTGYEGMIYDTQYFDNQYLDFVLRFGDIKNEFEAVNAVGALPIATDYHQKYAALSAEYGLRYTDARGMFFEPQAQLQLAYLADADYEAQRGIAADIDSALSTIGRIGLRFGKAWELENGFTNEIYVRTDLLHEFTDGQDATYSDGTSSPEVTWGNKDTWYDFGVGGVVHLGDLCSLAVDISKEVGGDVSDTWEINAQARFIF